MARAINKLSARTVTTETRKGRYADGGGLYLQVNDSGSKSWLFRFQMNGQAHQMGLGSVNTFSLAEARRSAEQCRKQLYEGINPIEHRKAERRALAATTAKVHTFKQCAEKLMKSKGADWENLKHANQWRSTLETYVYPVFGSLDVNAVDTGLVLQVLEPLWDIKAETARRVRGRIEAVLDWARARGWREGENPARWKGHLDQLLSKRGRSRVQNHPALPYSELGDFMHTLAGQDGVAARGLEFLILTAARTGEVIGATWDEIDLDGKTWTVPASRMKAGKPHRVPLSDAAITILQRMAETRQSEYVFPGMRRKSPLSNMAFLALLKRMERTDITPHGFRSTFKDWTAEQTAYPNELSEMALAHTVASKVEAAYRRGDLFDKRRRLMDDWAVFATTDTAPAGEVVAIRAGVV